MGNDIQITFYKVTRLVEEKEVLVVQEKLGCKRAAQVNHGLLSEWVGENFWAMAYGPCLWLSIKV